MGTKPKSKLRLRSGRGSLRLLHKHVHPRETLELLSTMRTLGLPLGHYRRLRREHEAYVQLLKTKLDMVPDKLERRLPTLTMLEAVRLLRTEMGIELREAVWFYKYLRQGIIPWFNDLWAKKLTFNISRKTI